MTWVFQRTLTGSYAIGFYTPQGLWVMQDECSDSITAASRVSYYNGGLHPKISQDLLEALAMHSRPTGVVNNIQSKHFT